MATRLKTSFKLAKSFTPIYTGGSVAVSADGERLYTTLNEDVVLTEVKTGERLHLFRGDTSAVTTLAVSSENASSAGVLVVAHRSLALRFYSADDFTLSRSVARAHDAPIIVAASDPTGSLFATGSADGIVKVWDATHAHCTHVFRGHGGVVSALYFDISPDRPPRLISASDDCRVRVWDLTTRKSLLVLDGHSSVVRGLTVTRDGNTLISGGRDKVLNLWDLPSGNLRDTLPVFETLEAIGLVEVPDSADNNSKKVSSKGKGKQKAETPAMKSLVWTAGDSGKVKLWDLATGKQVSTGSTAQSSNEAKTHEIVHVASTSDSLITAHVDQNLIFHSLPSLKPFRQIVGFNDEVIDLLYLCSSPSSNLSSPAKETHLAVATNSDLIRLYDLGSFDTELLAGHGDVVLCLARNKLGDLLMSGSKDRTARIWRSSKRDENEADDMEVEEEGTDSAQTGWECVAICEGHVESVGAVAVARRSANFAVTASQDRTVKIWDLASLDSSSNSSSTTSPVSAKALTTLKVHDKDINSIDLSPNDKLLVTGSQDKTAKLFGIEYTASSRARPQAEAKLVPLGVFKGHKRGVWSVKFSPADQVLATGSGDRTVKLWSINDFTCLKTFEGHTNTILRIDYLPAGNQLASCGSDGLVKIWNLKDEENVCTLDNHTDKIWSLASNSDASVLVSGGADSVISFWEDVTLQEEEEKIAAEEETILKAQDLANYMDVKDYRNAILLALSMDQPRRLLGLLTDILAQSDPDSPKDGPSPVLAGVLATLEAGDIFRLLEYVRDWNAKSRDADVAQSVLHTLFKTRPTAQILAAAPSSTGLEASPANGGSTNATNANIGDILEALLPYTERHYARADRLEQESAFLDFVLAQMDEYYVDVDGDGDGMQVDGIEVNGVVGR